MVENQLITHTVKPPLPKRPLQARNIVSLKPVQGLHTLGTHKMCKEDCLYHPRVWHIIQNQLILNSDIYPIRHFPKIMHT